MRWWERLLEGATAAALYGGVGMMAYGLTRDGGDLADVDELVAPLDRLIVTSPFGRPREAGPHKGVDLRAPVGTRVRAPEAGIARVTESDRAGLSITIYGDSGRVHGLSHLSEAAIDDGERVSAGQLIAWSGKTGQVTGPHLHWQTFVRGAPVDPLSLVKRGWEVGRAAGERG